MSFGLFWAAPPRCWPLLPNNFLAVVFSGLFWAASPRCWPLLPNRLPRGDVFRLALDSSSAVLDLAAQLLPSREVFCSYFGQPVRFWLLCCPINSLAVVLSGLFWAALPRCWPWLPNNSLAGSFLLILWVAATLLALVLPNPSSSINSPSNFLHI